MERARKLYDQRLRDRKSLDNSRHNIGFIGGAGGIGKSRALIELANAVTTWKKKGQWTFELVISYSNGNHPQCDRNLFGASSERYKSAATALALRILYFAFVYGKVFNSNHEVSFESFVRTFPDPLIRFLTPEDAVEVITLYQADRYGHRNGVIFIGLDDVNYLLDDHHTSQVTRNAFLRETLISLGSSMFHSSAFVFIVAAGTTVLPVDIEVCQLSQAIEKFPIGLLSSEDCEELITQMLPAHKEWIGWRCCRAFKSLWADFASLPRKAEQLLALVDGEIKKGTALEHIDYQVIYCRLISQWSLSTVSESLVTAIVTDTLLANEVRRDSAVGDVGNDRTAVTYGELEVQGTIVLETTPSYSLVVQLPFALFRLMVKELRATDPLTVCLRNVCSLNTPTNEEDTSAWLRWQSFEDFHCNIEDIREILRARGMMPDEEGLGDTFIA